MITDINELDLSKSYTYADYLNWQFSEMVELIKGKVYKMSPAPKNIHQLVSGNLHFIIKRFLWKQKCQIRHAPFDVRFVKTYGEQIITTVIQPDLCVICDPSKIDEAGCLGAPDFIIEILSPSTRDKDLHEKFDIYEEYGVNEYWIVDPLNKIVDVFVLENEKYRLVRKFTDNDTVSVNSLPGLEIDLKDVFEG
ncbi:MAG: Uma2 family endonuclease [Cytophagales bacterium]